MSPHSAVSLERAFFIAILLTPSVAPMTIVTAQILPTFSILISPSPLTVSQASQGSALVTVTSVNNFVGSLQLSFAGVPSEVQVSFGSNPVTVIAGGQTSTSATFSVSSNVLPSTYPIILIASSGQQNKNYQYSLIVQLSASSADFTISVSPSSVAVQQGTSVPSAANIAIASVGGFSSAVSLSYSGAPSGVALSFSPNQVTPPSDGTAYSSVEISVGVTSAGYYPITLTGASGGGDGSVISHSTQLTLQVVGPSADFSITVSPTSLTVQQGSSTSATLTITSIQGFSSVVAVSVAGIPSGLSANLSPNPILVSSGSSASSAVSLGVSSSAAPGDYHLTITGNSGSIVHPTTLTVTVTQGTGQDFSISPFPPTISISQGMSGTVLLTVASINGFNSPVVLGISWVGTPPSGVTFTVPGTVTPPSGGTISASLTIATGIASILGIYTFTVTGSSSSISHSVSIIVQIASGTGDFNLTIDPSTIIIPQGSGTNSTVTVQSSGAFYAPVTLTSSIVGGISINFATNPVSPSIGGSVTSQVAVSVSDSVVTGTYVITLTGTSGSFSHTTTLTIVVNPRPIPDFSILVTPTAILLDQGLADTETITITSLNGFSSPIELSATWVSSAPGDVTFSLPGPITPTKNQSANATMTISALQDATAGNFTLRIIATSEPLLHTADLSVLIRAVTSTTTTSVATSSTMTPTAQCLIATATYGSELAPQVQFLRDFRDKLVMKTFAGSNFMLAFNAWYYSFSPAVARFVSQHGSSRATMRIALYPLIPILTIGVGVFHILPGNHELAALLSGLSVAMLLGITYLALPMIATLGLNSRARRSSKRLVKYVTAVLLSAMMAAAVAELFGIAQIMILAAPMIVLSALVLSSLLVPQAVLALLECRSARNS